MRQRHPPEAPPPRARVEVTPGLAHLEITFVAVCFADGFDIGRNMVHTGWALAYRSQSTVYIDTEEAARKAKRGMWRGTFVKPWDWRRP